jgi:hypothetical protein
MFGARSLGRCLLGLAVAPLLAASPQRPGAFELEQALYERLHRDVGGMAHCRRTKAVRCAPAGEGRYLCRYKEMSGPPISPWVARRTVVAQQGQDWVWVSGDTAKCSVTFFE